MFDSNRIFQVWDASSSFSRIMLRSPKNVTDNYHMNIDIVFWGVKYINIPWVIRGFSLVNTEDNDSMVIEKYMGYTIDKDNIYTIISQNMRYYVVATKYIITENDIDIFEGGF
jgi:hypothetical protein